MRTFKIHFGWLLIIGAWACSSPTASSNIGGEEPPLAATLIPFQDDETLQRAEERNAEGAVLSEGLVKNGVKHGSWIYYNATGIVTGLESYELGVKEGVTMQFDAQGNLEKKIFYHQNEFHGEVVSYERNKVTEIRPYSYGVLQGLVRKFYTNGKIMEESLFNNGKLDGIAKWYDQEGNLTIAYRYEGGELVDKNPEIEE